MNKAEDLQKALSHTNAQDERMVVVDVLTPSTLDITWTREKLKKAKEIWDSLPCSALPEEEEEES